MHVSVQKPINFINECNCKVDVEDLEKALVWYQSRPTRHNKKIYIYGFYPAVSIHDTKIHVHRLLMLYWFNGNIPESMVVHHLNGDKLDARKENLAIMHGSGHVRSHLKGVPLSLEHRKKISLAGRRRKGIQMKKRVDIPLDELKQLLKEGKSINSIADFYKCDWTTVKSRIIQHPELLNN